MTNIAQPYEYKNPAKTHRYLNTLYLVLELHFQSLHIQPDGQIDQKKLG
jgi:hypothetical protein